MSTYRLMDKEVWYIDTVKYYSAMKNEILSYVTTWIDLECIMLNEISQIKAFALRFHLYV